MTLTLQQLWQGWRQFWFKPVPADSISVYRIFFGLLTFFWGLSFIAFPQLWWDKVGLLTAKTIEVNHLGPSFNPCLKLDDYVIEILIGIYCFAAVCLTVGLFTRLSSAVIFMLMLCFCNRNLLALNTGDYLLELLSLLLIFAPAGKMYSIDSWLTTKSDRQTNTHCYAPWAQRLIQLQIVVVYWQTFWSKLSGETWLNGTAVYYVLHLTEYCVRSIPYVPDHLWVCKILTWLTLVVQACFWGLIWIKEFRYWVLLIGVVFHLALNWCLEIPIFQFILIISYVVFIDPIDLRQFLSRVLWFVHDFIVGDL